MSLSNSRLSFLDANSKDKAVVPSSSTQALRNIPGQLSGWASIQDPDIQGAMTELHLQDLQAGASFAVTGTCGMGVRRVREKNDLQSFPKGIQTLSGLEDFVSDSNEKALKSALSARDQYEQEHQEAAAVLGSIVTSSDCYDPRKKKPFDLGKHGSHESVINAYREDHIAQISGLTSDPNRKVDALLIEAGGVSFHELLAIAMLSSESETPLIASLVVNDQGDILDPDFTGSLEGISRELRSILGPLFLGLGLNCNSHEATLQALRKDKSSEIRMVYPNQAQLNTDQRARHAFTEARSASIDEEVQFAETLLKDFEHVCVIGCCCRDERSEVLIHSFRQLIETRFAPIKQLRFS